MGRRRALAVLVAALVAVGTGLAVLLTGAFGHLEQGSVDARFALRHTDPPRGIVLVGIDDQTFHELGRPWPLPRSLHGRAIDRLHAAGAKEIVYDVQFSEPTRPAEDLALYDAIGRAGGAVLGTTEIDAGRTRVLGGDDNLRQVRARAAAANLPVDRSGTATRLRRSIDGLQTMAVVAAERATGRALPASAFPADGAWVDYRGASGTFPALSFGDVVQGHFDSRLVRGQIVVIGATTPSLQDVHRTPVDGNMTGPEIQANAIWSALHGLPLRSGPPWLDLALVVALGLAVPLARLRLRLLVAAALGPALALALLAGAQLAFDAGTIVAVVAPLASLAVGTAGMVVASHLAETRERSRVSRDNEVLERLVRERTEELRDTQLEVIQRLGQAAESRDGDTGLHIERISRLCHGLGLAAGLGADEADLLRHASAMHDVGKIGIPDRILLKPGRLDPAEWETMKTHSTVGAAILAGSRSPLVQMAHTIALTHHERWDGSGYPAALAGEAIPLVGRICAVCDVFDALVSERPYKRAWSLDEALAEIERSAGTHLDPHLVGLFLEARPWEEAGVPGSGLAAERPAPVAAAPLAA